LASASWDNSIKVWDVEKGQELLTLKGRIDPFCSLSFSADGKRLVSGGDTVKVWDAGEAK
jgi:WD40 repeat protein